MAGLAGGIVLLEGVNAINLIPGNFLRDELDISVIQEPFDLLNFYPDTDKDGIDDVVEQMLGMDLNSPDSNFRQEVGGKTIEEILGRSIEEDKETSSFTLKSELDDSHYELYTTDENLMGRLLLLNEQEKEVIAQLCDYWDISSTTTIEEFIADPRVRSVLAGSHVEFEDGGEFYESLSTIEGIQERQSSHTSDTPQYAFQGNLLSEVLFGSRDGNSWFQLENSSLQKEPVEHGVDYLKYLASEQNIGPFGESSYTESNPMEFVNVEELD